jgi:hypothetical protein
MAPNEGDASPFPQFHRAGVEIPQSGFSPAVAAEGELEKGAAFETLAELFQDGGGHGGERKEEVSTQITQITQIRKKGTARFGENDGLTRRTVSFLPRKSA